MTSPVGGTLAAVHVPRRESALSRIADVLREVGVSAWVTVTLLRDSRWLRLRRDVAPTELPTVAAYGLDDGGHVWFVEPRIG